MISEITGGTHVATTYNGIGSGLVGVPRANFETAGATQTVFTTSTGALTSGILPNALGGTGLDTSTLTGVLTINGGVTGSLPCGTTAVANSIVRRNGTGGITESAVTTGTLIVTSTPAADAAGSFLAYDPGSGAIKLATRNAAFGSTGMLRSVLSVASQSIAANTLTAVQFTATSDPNLTWDGALYTWTVATAGVYFISATLQYATSTSALRNINIVYDPVGTIIADNTMASIVTASGSPACVAANRVCKCAVGDTFTVQAFTTTATTITNVSQITFVKFL